MTNETLAQASPAAVPGVQDRFPTAYTILFVLIVVVAALTWILPAGPYQRAANAALGKDAAVPGTCQVVEAAHQGVQLREDQGSAAGASGASVIAFCE